MKPTLLILAAGLGARYGGLKQMEAVGPAGETIIDYSIYDAVRTGFGRVVFVIRPEIEAAFRAVLAPKFEAKITVEYAYQELDRLPDGFSPPPERRKPWGTGHAVWVAAALIHEPFVVINADDFYGATSFSLLGNYLSRGATAGATVVDSGPADYALVGFRLRQTLSSFGSVARAVCRCDAQNFLQEVVELKRIEKVGERARYLDEAGQAQPLSGDEIVSMNMWGFRPAIFAQLQQLLKQFLQEHGHEAGAEFLLPTAVNSLIAQGQARVKVLPGRESWFGMTYQADRAEVVQRIRDLIDRGQYPEKIVPEKALH